MNITKISRVAAAALTLASSTGLTGCGVFVKSRGERVGNVVQLAEAGGPLGICKTSEGEIALGNMRGASTGGSGNTFDFHVEDPTIRAQLQKAMDNLTTVKVEFTEVSMPWFCTQKSGHTITKVTEMSAHMPFLTNGLLSGAEGNGQPAGGAVPVEDFARGNVLLLCRPAQAASKP